MFEPIGGSAPKYTGKNVINPLAAICAGSMLLEFLGDRQSDTALTKAGLTETAQAATTTAASATAKATAPKTAEIARIVNVPDPAALALEILVGICDAAELDALLTGAPGFHDLPAADQLHGDEIMAGVG